MFSGSFPCLKPYILLMHSRQSIKEAYPLETHAVIQGHNLHICLFPSLWEAQRKVVVSCNFLWREYAVKYASKGDQRLYKKAITRLAFLTIVLNNSKGQCCWVRQQRKSSFDE